MQKISREWAVLLCILIAAFAVRMATFKYYLMGFDPAHHFAIGKFIVEGNGFPEIWQLSNYPYGARIGEPPGLYYVSVALYWFLKPFGISYFSAFKLSTPLFGTLTILPMYFFVKDSFNGKTALYAALILAFMPAFMYRTFSGFYRGDAFSVFFMVMGFYLFFRSLESDLKKRAGFAVSAGMSFGMMGLVWNGFLFGFVVLSAFIVVYSLIAYLQEERPHGLILAYALSAGIGILIIKYSIMQYPRVENYITDLVKYIYPLTLVISLCFTSLEYKTRGLSSKNKVYVVGVLVLAGIFIAYHFFGEVIKNLYTGYGMVMANEGIMATIGELNPPSNGVLFDKYGLAGIIAIPGAFYLLREKPLKMVVFSLVWLAASVFVMKMAVRYTFIASLPIAVAGGYFLYRIELGFQKKEIRLLTMASLVFIALTGLVFAAEQKAHITPQWVEALEILGKEEPCGVFTWWDYGSWIQGITGFPTMLDTVTGQGHIDRIQLVGTILLEKNSTKALAELEKMNVNYIVIPVDMIGQMTNINFMLNNGQDPQYVLFPRTGDVSINGIPAQRYGTNMYVFDIEGGKVVAVENSGNLVAFKRAYYRTGDALVKREYNDLYLPTVDRAVYISQADLLISKSGLNDFLIPIEPRLEGTVLTSLMLLEGEGFEGVELLYGNQQVKIYKVRK